MKISVIIPTHNRHKALAETLAGLQTQMLDPADYEILVMDDGSTPPIEITAGHSSHILRVIRLEGVERSVARNTGARLAEGRFLLFLDDDIGVKEDFLALHLRAHDECPGALVVGAIQLPTEMLTTPFGRFRQHLEQDGLPALRGVANVPNLCTAANMSIDRKQFFAMGGFRGDLVSGEDQDLALRHTKQGGQIFFIPEAKAIHYDHSYDLQSYCRRVEWGSENVVAFYQSWPQWIPNQERHQVNSPLRLFQEPLPLSLRKLTKSLLALPFLLQSLVHFTLVWEQVRPQSTALARLYRLLLGIHLQRGYRKGLKKHDLFGPAQTPSVEFRTSSF